MIRRLLDYLKRKETKNNLATLIYFSIVPLVIGALLLALLDYSSWQAFCQSCLKWRNLVFVIVFALTFPKMLMCIGCIIACGSYRASIKKTMTDYVITKQGAPGCGKSATGFYEAVYKARLLEDEVRYKYWQLTGKTEISQKEWLEYQELKQAILFYDSHPGAIPCLVTNTGCKDGQGRYSIILTTDMLTQKQLIPAYTVIWLDETGDTLDNHGFISDTSKTINEVFKYPRHYGEFHLILAEQEGSNMLIGCRRPTAYTELLVEQKPYCKPQLIIAVLGFCKTWLWFKYYKNKNKTFRRLVTWCEKTINNLGYRKITTVRQGNNMIEGNPLASKKRTIIVESALNCDYDNRAYRNGYEALGKPIDAEIYDSLQLTRKQIDQNRKLRKKLLAKPK